MKEKVICISLSLVVAIAVTAAVKIYWSCHSETQSKEKKVDVVTWLLAGAIGASVGGTLYYITSLIQ